MENELVEYKKAHQSSNENVRPVDERINEIAENLKKSFKNVGKDVSKAFDSIAEDIMDLKKYMLTTNVKNEFESDKTKDLEKLIEKTEAISNKIKTSNADIAEFELLINKLKTNFNNISTKTNEIQNDISKNESKLNILSVELNDLVEKAKMVKSKITDKTSEIEALSEEYYDRQSQKKRIVRLKVAWRVFFWITMLLILSGSIVTSYWIVDDLRNLDNLFDDFVLQLSIPGFIVTIYSLSLFILLPMFASRKKSEFFEAITYTIVFVFSIVVILIFVFTWSSTNDAESKTIAVLIGDWWSDGRDVPNPIWELIKTIGPIIVPLLIWIMGVSLIIPLITIGFIYHNEITI